MGDIKIPITKQILIETPTFQKPFMFSSPILPLLPGPTIFQPATIQFDLKIPERDKLVLDYIYAAGGGPSNIYAFCGWRMAKNLQDVVFDRQTFPIITPPPVTVTWITLDALPKVDLPQIRTAPQIIPTDTLLPYLLFIGVIPWVWIQNIPALINHQPLEFRHGDKLFFQYYNESFAPANTAFAAFRIYKHYEPIEQR